MTDVDRLERYWLHEGDWTDIDELRDRFEWEVPGTFNMARVVCERWAEATPAETALFVEDESGASDTYTFAELDAAASRLANLLADEGVTRGDRVGVNLPQKPETAIAHIACWKLGAVSVPLSTLFGPEGLGLRLGDCDATAAVVDASNVGALRDATAEFDLSLDPVLTVGEVPDRRDDERDLHAATAGYDDERAAPATDAEADAMVIYTSGTTGAPKGVRHAHRMLLGHLPGVQLASNLHIGEAERYWTPAEWAWIASLFDIVFPALFYGQPVLAYHGGEFDPATAFELLERYDITMFFAPPTALRFMMRVDGDYDVESLRVIASGGESLGRAVADWADETFGGAAVHEGYGQTEANVVVTECSALGCTRDGSMGVAAPGHEVTVVDPETAEELPPGEVGEIAVRYEGDPVCFKEYWNRPDRTAGKLRNGWLLTEDLGRRDEDGFFEFQARKDDVIISSGYRIGPEEIEDTLAAHEAVADAAVIGVPHDERGEVPKAFVVLAGREPAAELRQALMTHVRDRLADYEYPREVEFLDELPQTSTGKVRRQSLREREGIAD